MDEIWLLMSNGYALALAHPFHAAVVVAAAAAVVLGFGGRPVR